jgi:hypothetical protein
VSDPKLRAPRVFVCSPALLSGVRGRRLLAGELDNELGRCLADGGTVPLGDVHAFISSLYFRGKRAYAAAFGRPTADADAAYVVTPDRGLVPVDQPVSLDDLARMADRRIDPEDAAYREPLLHTARELDAKLGRSAQVVLLGSIASEKYLPVLLEVWAERLLFPEAFVGRGDMSRGGLMLRAVRAGRELGYVSAAGAARRGPRPPRLDG